MTEAAEKLLKEYDAMEMDIEDPFEAAAKLAGVVYMDALRTGGEIPHQEAVEIAVRQLKKYLSIKFIGQVLVEMQSNKIRMAEDFEPLPPEAA